ncbi:hypothetical protein [Prosthecomicrobium sp. N25]|uniref:hypothetical protein n=1 Tax=Prosthecomicrobium sp. N25 TaxID=3129254 RepID=UPI003077849F
MIAIGSILIAAGSVAILLFLYLTLKVQPRLFPGEVVSPNDTVSARVPRSHLAFGLALAGLLIAGVGVFSLGSAMVATTLGYGHG